VLIAPLKALGLALVALVLAAPATPASAPSVTPMRTIVIGHSVRGRRIIAVVRGPNDAQRKILVVGCIHGNECAGLAIISALERPPGRQGRAAVARP
jgi:murein peptide amidase A